jgi:hypothetical protein
MPRSCENREQKSACRHGVALGERKDALRQGVGFFKQHLAGVQLSKAQDAAAAAVKSVGVLLIQ